jgi:hypothetical protein
MGYFDDRVWNEKRHALSDWYEESQILREQYARLLADPEVRSRAAQCWRLLVDEGTGTVGLCGGAVHACYIRRGSKGRWTRVGTVCRHCGHFTPDGPLQHEQERRHLREATPEEYERWRQEKRAE